MKEDGYIFALAKIRKLLNDYFAELGRGQYGEYEESMNEKSKEIIEKIDSIVGDVNIPDKYKIVNALRDDE